MNIRLLRGQVVVREDHHAATREFTHIVVPELGTAEERARKRTSHVARVLAMGPPALTRKGVEVPHGFAVGDTVVFSWATHEKSWTRPWVDGELAAWIPQECVHGVVECALR
jgi:co-chaperonin GroES (HSP10)